MVRKFKVNYGDNVHPGLTFPDPQKYPMEKVTKQSFKDECDINVIVKRYRTTGILPEIIKQNPQYGEFADVPSYQEAQEIYLKANEQFMSLNSHVRDRFGHDPGKFLEFATNPKNAEEMIKLGLATKKNIDTALNPVSDASNGDKKKVSSKKKSPDSKESGD